MVLKKGLIAFTLFLIVITSIFLFAGFASAKTGAAERATNWLLNNTNLGSSTEAVAFTTLVFDGSEHSERAKEGLNALVQRQAADGCFPKDGCKVKDTALALLVLDNFRGEAGISPKREKALIWLNNSQRAALTSGVLWLQLATTEDTTCKVAYDNIEKIFTIKNGKIVECANQEWLNIGACLDQRLLTGLKKELEVNCNVNAIISLIYQQGNNYYILQEEHSNKAVIELNNACFGSSSSSQKCDYEATGFASWVLKELNEDVNAEAYLKSNFRKDNILDMALLTLVTKKEVYADELKKLQGINGDFGTVYNTAFAIMALKDLKEISNATSWLEFEQEKGGSWNSNMLDTSVAMYAISLKRGDFEDEEEPYCGDGRCLPNEDEISCPEDCAKKKAVCGNNILEGFEECDGTDDNACPGKCSPAGKIDECICLIKAGGCITEGYTCCDECVDISYPEFDASCNLKKCCSECKLAEELICDDGADNDEDGLIDCKDSDCEESSMCKEGGFPWWIVITFLVVFIAGLAGYLAYRKFVGGGGEKEEEEYTFKPRVERAKEEKQAGKRMPLIIPKKEAKTKLDIDLEKSVEEAKKLFGKK